MQQPHSIGVMDIKRTSCFQLFQVSTVLQIIFMLIYAANYIRHSVTLMNLLPLYCYPHFQTDVSVTILLPPKTALLRTWSPLSLLQSSLYSNTISASIRRKIVSTSSNVYFAIFFYIQFTNRSRDIWRIVFYYHRVLFFFF